MAAETEQAAAPPQSALTAEIKRWLARLRPLADQLRARYNKLEQREKRLVQIGGAVAGMFLLYNLIYLPAQSLSEGLETRIQARQREVVEVQRLVDSYQRLKGELGALEKRTVPPSKDFSLFSVLEGTLTKTIGREKIGSITPADRKISNELVEYTVDVKLSGLSLAQLVDALYGVKTLTVPVFVSNLSIKKRFQDPHSFDVDLTCFALGKSG